MIAVQSRSFRSFEEMKNAHTIDTPEHPRTISLSWISTTILPLGLVSPALQHLVARIYDDNNENLLI